MAKIEKQWRYSTLERRLIRAWLKGERAEIDHAAREPAERPTVSGEFIARLWLGEFGQPEHASRRLLLRGLRVTGRLALSDIRHDLAGSDTLPLFMAEDCTFEAPVRIIMCRTESLSFRGCTFVRDENSTAAVTLQSSRIEGDVEFDDCVLDGILLLESTQITTQLMIRRTVCSDGASLMGLTCERHVHIEKCRFGEECGLKLDRLKAATRCFVWDSRIVGNFWLRWLSTGSMEIDRCTVSAPLDGMGLLDFTGLRTTHGAQISRVLVAGSTIGRDIDVAANLSLTRVVAGSPSVPGGIDLRNGRIGKDLSITQAACRRGVMTLADCKIGDRATLARVKAPSLDLQRLQTRIADISETRIETELYMPEMRVAGLLRLLRISVGVPADWLSADAKAEQGGEIVATGTQATTGLHVIECAIGRALDLGHCRTGQAYVARTVILGDSAEGNLRMQSIRCEGLVALQSIGCRRVNCSMMSAEVLEVGGLQIGSSEAAADDIAAFHAADIEVRRRVLFHTLPAEGPNRVIGQVYMRGARIDGDLMIHGGYYGLAPSHEARTTLAAFSLLKAQVGGSIFVGAPVRLLGAEAKPGDNVPAFDGCLRLDDCNIAADIRLNSGVAMHFAPAIGLASDDVDSVEVMRDKATIALSVLNSQVHGTLSLEAFRFDGTVDLRESHIGRISDENACAWSESGVGQGQLLLDGLTYDDLDFTGTVQKESPVRRIFGALVGRGGSDEAEIRLGWLAQSYPAAETGFSPQPYEQLAHYFTLDGDERSRRHVLVAKRERQRRFGGLGLLERGLGWVLKTTSNYGYSPARALLGLLAFFALGTVFAWLLGSAGAIQPNSTDLVSPYPYNYFVLAVDSAIPVIDLDHDSMLTIDPSALPWWASKDSVLVGKALYEIIGMLLLSITILTLTGTLREKE